MCQDLATPQSVVVLERTFCGKHGGNTRFTPCCMRMDETHRVSPGLVEEMLAVSDGRNDRAYFIYLVEDAPATMAWLEAHGIAFHKPGYYLAAGPQRIQPVGGGETLVRELTRAAKSAGIDFLYDCDALGLVTDTSGTITGSHVGRAGSRLTIAARSRARD